MIREAGSADRAAVVALWRACGLTRPWNDPDADFDLALASAGSTVLVSGDPIGGPVSGSVMVGFDGHRGWVYYLAVAEELRRSGLGRRLMQAAEAWLAGRGAPKIQLMVRSDNAEAMRFYAALGLETQSVAVLGRRLDGN